VHPELIAKTAIFARTRAGLADMPALLCAMLSKGSPDLLERVFPRVFDSWPVLRAFVGILRSGVVGRRSLGSRPKRLVAQWLDGQGYDALVRASLGGDPSLADVLRLAHPKPPNPARRAFYAWVLGRPHEPFHLPRVLRDLDRFKAGTCSAPVPAVPLALLTGLALSADAWKQVARQADWSDTRCSLNAFARQGVFQSRELTEVIARRLRDRRALEAARPFPHALLATLQHLDPRVPRSVDLALQDALDVAVSATPTIAGKVFVFVDVSASMAEPVTGRRGLGKSTVVRRVDLAALVAAAILRRNPTATVVPFHDESLDLDLNPRDSVATNAARIATTLDLHVAGAPPPLERLEEREHRGDLVVVVSDNGARPYVDPFGPLDAWDLFRQRNPGARLVCIDLSPTHAVHLPERADILHVGGFSDHVFDLLGDFARGELRADHWVQVIDAIPV
jgi:60 kDa SS-A/Ro ribonucleoprotein